MKHYKDIVALESNLIKMEETIEELNVDKCIHCGAHIQDKEILELTKNQLILTYICPKCGLVGDQYFTLNYERTDIM